MGPLGYYYSYLFLHYQVHRKTRFMRSYQNFSATAYEKGAFNTGRRFVQLLSCGEGLHNNHHHSLGEENFAYNTTEIDIGFTALKLLASIHLVHWIRKPIIRIHSYEKFKTLNKVPYQSKDKSDFDESSTRDQDKLEHIEDFKLLKQGKEY